MPENAPSTAGDAAENLHSYHVFLFPFKWKRSAALATEKEFSQITEAVAAATFTPAERDPVKAGAQGKSDQSGRLKKWNSDKDFDVDTLLNYNEYFYFYDYVREILFERPDTAHDAQFPAIRHFRFNLLPGAKYYIQAPNPDGESQPLCYELEIDDILLHLYYTGVGVLSFHLINRGGPNHSQNSSADIRYINQFGRRVYPPYFRVNTDTIGDAPFFNQQDFTEALPTGQELAYKIGIEGIFQGRCTLEQWDGYLEERRNPVDGSFLLTPLFQPFLAEIDAGFRIEPILDDRMFVLCWYGDDELSEGLYDSEAEEPNRFLASKEWYKLVFVDGGLLTVQHATYQAELVKKATNYRWARYGTFFGVTDYSFIMLTGGLASLRENNSAFLVTHAMTLYYKLVELALVQRASVQRFSDEITRVAYLTGDNDHRFAEAAENLYRKYIRFVNRIYFREVTPQVQGIELYDKLHEQSRLRDQVESLKQEIHELHNFVLQQAERKRNKRLNNLNILIAAFAPPSLLLAWYAMGDMLPPGSLTEPLCFFVVAAAAVSSAAASLLAYWKSESWIGYVLAGGFFILLMVLPQIWLPCEDPGMPAVEKIDTPPIPAPDSFSLPTDSTENVAVDTVKQQ